MHNHAITAPQRVLYVSGMLLANQILRILKKGLVPEDLKGIVSTIKEMGTLL